MKFNYEYRTSDNVRHTGVIAASDRGAAFAALKAQGIRPGCLAEAPGFFNKLFGKGKRWLAIVVLGAGCLVLGAIIHSTPPTSDLQPLAESLDSAVRRQILGDSAVIEKGIRTGWADVFDLEGDRFLASFAIPGVEPALRTTTEEKLKEALKGEATPSSLGSKSTTTSSLESRQIISIVEGMKREALAYLAAGGTLVGYGNRLVQRQQAELAHYNRVKTELETMQKSGLPEDELEALWERRNNELRQMGVKLVPMPD